MIDTITTSNFSLELQENNEKDMTAQVFGLFFYFSWRQSQIGLTADFAIPPPYDKQTGRQTSIIL